MTPEAHAPSACGVPCPLGDARVADVGGLDRRQFLSRAALGAAVLALAACGVSDGMVAPFTGTYTLTLADYPQLATVGGVALVNANGAALAVVHADTTSYVALSRTCPHQGFTVNRGGNGFVCPGHGALFSLSGAWQGGQPTSNLRAYPTTLNSAAGTLTIG